MSTDVGTKMPRKPFWVPWFWEIPEFELDEQIEQYETLGWFRSYRKLSCLLLSFQTVLGLLLATTLAHRDLTGTAITAALYLLLALGSLSGNRAALSIVMLVFTIDRGTMLVLNFFNPLAWLVGIAWWAFFMERFWRAYDVSRVRSWRRLHPTTPETGPATARATGLQPMASDVPER